MPQAPCKNCEHKCVGCHGKCEAYNQYKQEQEKYKKLVRLSQEINAYQRTTYAKIKRRSQIKSKWRGLNASE